MKERIILLDDINDKILSPRLAMRMMARVEIILPKGTRIPNDVKYDEIGDEIIVYPNVIVEVNTLTNEITDRTALDKFISTLNEG